VEALAKVLDHSIAVRFVCLKPHLRFLVMFEERAVNSAWLNEYDPDAERPNF